MTSRKAALGLVDGAPPRDVLRWQSVLAAAMRAIDRASEAVVVLALVGELIMVLANVVARVWFNASFLWADEVARLSLSTLAFIGGAVAYRRRDHAFVQVILALFPDRGRRACLALADLVVIFVCVTTGVASIEFITSSWSELTPILQMPAPILALPLPIGLALITAYAALNLRRDHGAIAIPVGIGLAAIVVVLAATRDLWLPALGDDADIFQPKRLSRA